MTPSAVASGAGSDVIKVRRSLVRACETRTPPDTARRDKHVCFGVPPSMRERFGRPCDPPLLIAVTLSHPRGLTHAPPQTLEDALKAAETSLRMVDATKKSVASNEKNLDDSKNGVAGCDRA